MVACVSTSSLSIDSEPKTGAYTAIDKLLWEILIGGGTITSAWGHTGPAALGSRISVWIGSEDPRICFSKPKERAAEYRKGEDIRIFSDTEIFCLIKEVSSPTGMSFTGGETNQPVPSHKQFISDRN